MNKTSAAETCVRCRNNLSSQRFYIKQQYTGENINVGPICVLCYTELKEANGEEVDGVSKNIQK